MELKRRRNLVHSQAERWRPPLFVPPATRWQRLIATLRRFFDLQFGSIWNDVGSVLGSVQGQVLDVGCGAQPLRGLLAPGATYLGIDTDEARDHFGYEVPDTLYFSGSTWPIEGGTVDLVLCTEVLEHVLKPDEVLSEAFRCLRPGGLLLLTVPFAARWHFIPHDYWRYTPSSLQHLFEANGFNNIAVSARGNEITVACYKVMALILPFVFPQATTPAAVWGRRAIGLMMIPFLFLLATVANLSLRFSRGGDDCLGFTATALKPVVSDNS